MTREVRWRLLLSAVAFCFAADVHAKAPTVPRGGGIWLQEDLRNGKARDKFVAGVHNTGRLRAKTEDDGIEDKLTYAWSVAEDAPGSWRV